MNPAEKFGTFGVQQRARQYDTTRTRAIPLAEGDDAVPIRAPRRQQPTRPAAPREANVLNEHSYRVRDAAHRAQAKAKARRTETASVGRQGRPRDQGRTIPEDRRRWQADPDSTRNTDAIFDGEQEQHEAVRIAQKRKAAHRGTLSALIGTLVFVFICFTALLVYKLIFVIGEFTVEGTSAYSTDEIVAAAGVQAGDNLYSFSSRDAEAALTLRLPYIRRLEVDRTLPDKVLYTVTEDRAAFCAEIYGELRVLSASLRVLERTDEESAAERGLIRLRLPQVKSAVAGRVLEFSTERNTLRIREILSEVIGSAMYGRITQVDLRDLRNLNMVSNDAYLLEFGDAENVAVKLRVAAAVLTDKIFDSTVRAQIDLSVPDSTSVVFDDQITFDH